MASHLLELTEAVLIDALNSMGRSLDVSVGTIGTQSADLADDQTVRELARRWSGRVEQGIDGSVRLQSIFSQIEPVPATAPVYARRPLSLKREVLFPDEAGKAKDDDTALRQALIQGCSTPPESIEARVEHWLETLRTVGWCIPARSDRPTVSVYDQARMEAALAACLSGASAANLNLWTRQEVAGIPAALLVGGDVSGIQSFLFTLSSKRAAKTLRGRSFYLQLLTEAALRLVLRELGLSTANVIYSGGGHFYILVPADAVDVLVTVQKSITETLWRHHGAALYLALGWAPVTAGQFEGAQQNRAEKEPAPTLGQAWQAMHAALRQAKQRRYAELGDSLYATVFERVEHGGNTEHICAVCGEERAIGARLPDEEEDADSIRVCRQCQSLADDLGTPLASANRVYLGLAAPDPTRLVGSAFDALAALGLHVSFDGQFGQDGVLERRVVWAFDDAARENLLKTARPRDVVIRRYTVDIPKSQALREFSNLIKERQGIKRLGVLRADVDDLGTMFRDAARSNSAALTTLAALSTAMSLYFEGWVTVLARDVTDAAGNRLVYGVYSGGDDLFLIGPWDRMPGLARQIAGDFEAYTGHPRTHLSAGLALIGEKYPVYQAAEDAGAALALAKHQAGKNSFGFLGQTHDWRAFADVDQKRQELIDMVGNDVGRRSLLQTLRELANQATAAKRSDGKMLLGPWLWRGAYQLVRFGDNHPSCREDIERIRDELAERDFAGIQVLGLAARWVQLLLRGDSDEEG